MKNLINQYDAFIIDLWGVVHDGVNAYPGVVETINHLLSINKAVVFLSNAPRPTSVVIQKLMALGIHVLPEQILTSGDVVREQFILWNDPIFRHLGKCFYHLDSAKNKDLLAGLKTEETQNLEEAKFVLLSAFMDASENLKQYENHLNQALKLQLPIICANPDKIVVVDDSIRYCSGTLAEQYEQMGGTVYYYGKPYANVFDVVFSRVKAKGVLDKKRMLMIGDTLETDILGANRAGIDSALVQTGNVGRLLVSGKSMEQIIQVDGIVPNWIIPSLAIEEMINS